MDLKDAPANVYCDRERMTMALRNLLDNAIKAISKNGEIEFGVSAETDHVKLWVSDNGTGIDSSELPKIFDRFYISPTNGTEGSGLGLALVQGVINAHDGKIQVTSKPGEGTRFDITLPNRE